MKRNDGTPVITDPFVPVKNDEELKAANAWAEERARGMANWDPKISLAFLTAVTPFIKFEPMTDEEWANADWK